MMFSYIYNTIIGNIAIFCENDFIVSIKFIDKNFNSSNIEFKETKLIKDTYKQLSEYFLGKRKFFIVPLKQNGTDFQNKVWNALKKIPYGETRSYKDIAIEIGNPKACRAVGMANNKNKIPIIIPCHRVIGINNKLVGYAGGLHIKMKLLELEKEYCF